jgi:predicted nuclease with TOPRIM domain
MDYIALFAALASVLAALYSYFKLREDRAKLQAEAKRVHAEAEKLHAEASNLAKQGDLDRAVVMIDKLQQDNERLRLRLREFEEKSEQRENELTALRVGVLILIDQLEQLGVAPRWIPASREYATKA